MAKLKGIEDFIQKEIAKIGYEIDSVSLEECSIKELGQFQLNFAMKLSKIYHKSPRDIAEEVKRVLDVRFKNVNIAGPGFINLSLKDEELLEYANEYINDFEKYIEYEKPKTIVVDYGGANAAKALHVGHMRSANIGEALKRLAKLFGNKVIGDVHLGDLGRQSGMLISQLMEEQPDLVFFDKNYKGEYPKINLTIEDLGRMYKIANAKAKEDETRMELVRDITLEIDKGNVAYTNLWKQIVEISEPTIKKVYNELNCTFDLWEGELSSMQYVDETLKVLKDYLYESEGALVIDVTKDDDKLSIPPLIVIKTNGATIYATRDLATIYNRVNKINPDEFWYVVDDRQSMYFEQVFRASYKTSLVRNDVALKFLGFGTINGTDGKPFKTRSGEVMELSSLISMVKEEITKKVKDEISDDRKEDIINNLTIATLKYADLLSYRKTDYVFDLVKFSSFEGKTGPYILYGIVRIKSLLKKLDIENSRFNNIPNDDVRDIILSSIKLSKVLNLSYREATLNYITDYLFEITNLFNKFYNNNNILNEKDKDTQETYIALLKFVYNICHNLLNILAINEVDEM
ncbi:MAG: arginine--tRNA ligase [Bacilli bacterium]|nr:arginine--tRNA ligase [Bacilli bacterium]